VNSAETLLGGDVYHYHSKMIMKDAKATGAWTWHQDYGKLCFNNFVAILAESLSTWKIRPAA
jgi:hypothetical protein